MLGILTRTVDARPLAVVRIIVGLASLPLVFEWFHPLWRVASGDFLAVPGFAWLPPVDPAFVLALAGVALVSGLAMALGIAPRLAGALVSITAALALVLDQQAYSNHLLLLVLLAALVAMSDAGSALTIRNRRGTTAVPYWPAFLIQLQITTLYAWTAIAKINPSYLSGEVIDTNLRSWVPAPPALLPAVAVATIAAEAFLAFALWVPRLRPAAFVVGAGLHVGILFVLVNPEPLVPFAALMFCGYVLFAREWFDAGPSARLGRLLAAANQPIRWKRRRDAAIEPETLVAKRLP